MDKCSRPLAIKVAVAIRSKSRNRSANQQFFNPRILGTEVDEALRREALQTQGTSTFRCQEQIDERLF